MTVPDLINGLFEGFSGAFTLLNIRKLYRDKQLRGCSWVTCAFFTSWSIWNVYFYPHLNQMISFIGGLVIGVTNLIYLSMMIYYTKRELNEASKASQA